MPAWAEGAVEVSDGHKNSGWKGGNTGGVIAGVHECLLVTVEAEGAKEAVEAVRRQYNVAGSGSCLAGKALTEVT